MSNMILMRLIHSQLILILIRSTLNIIFFIFDDNHEIINKEEFTFIVDDNCQVELEKFLFKFHEHNQFSSPINTLAFNSICFKFHDPFIAYIFAKKYSLNEKVHILHELRIEVNSLLLILHKFLDKIN